MVVSFRFDSRSTNFGAHYVQSGVAKSFTNGCFFNCIF